MTPIPWKRSPGFRRLPTYCDLYREDLKSITLRLLRTHPMRASDSLQLGAALWWCGGFPEGREFICLDQRLRDAASAEGFNVLPDEPLSGS